VHCARFGSSLSVMGEAELGSTLSLRSYARFGSTLAVLGFLRLGSSMSLRRLARVGSSLSLLGCARVGSCFSVLSFSHLGASLAMRSFARMGSSVAVLDFVHLGSSLSVRSACRIGHDMHIKRRPTLSISDIQTYVKYDKEHYTGFQEFWGSKEHEALLWYTQGASSLRLTQHGGSLHGLWYLDADGANMEASSSDRRLKKNIRPLFETLGGSASGAAQDRTVLDALMHRLEPKAYRLKGDAKHTRFGFIADEMEQVLPQITRTAASPERRKGIMYQDLIAFLTNMMQDLFADLSTASSRLQAVEGRIQLRKKWRRRGTNARL